jgi:uncharacterized protein involved in exopolysaccharide biosynthesis
MSLAQITCIVRAHWKRSAIATLALMFVFAVLIKLAPKSYVATATLIINNGDKDPLASSDFPVGPESAFIPTQIELMQSPVVLGQVVKQLHLASDPLFVHGFSGPPAALLEAVITNLRKSVSVYQGSGSDLLYVSVTDKQPAKAAAIANAVADEYLQLNQQRIDEPAAQRAKRYSEELTQLRANTIAAQDKVTAFRQQHAMVDLSPEKADAAEAALQDLQQKLLAVQNSERDLQSRLQTPSGGGEATAAEPDAGSLSKKLAEEQAELAHLSSTLGPRFPSVVALKSQMAATQRAIRSNGAAQLASIGALEEKYQVAIAEQQKLVLDRRKIQDAGAKLLLELQSANSTYKRALDGYDQIEFATASHAADVSLISRASPPAIAEKPNKIKYFLMCCILSAGAGLVIPFAYDLLLDRRLRCRDDLERQFGIPVLIQLEPIIFPGAKESG